MLQITLTQKGHDKPITAMTADELYEAGRHAWVLGSKADRERFALIVYNNTVLQAVEIDDLEEVTVINAHGREQRRRAIVGRVLSAGHPVYDAFVGQVAPMRSTQNPIKYVESEHDLTPCLCGCGEIVRSAFVAGHDQRAIHERIAKFGTVAKFLTWFDATYDATASAA